MPHSDEGIIDKLWNLFSSMKTGLFLLGVIAVSAGVGTLIPQAHLYTSVWFEFLLGLLCINLVVCSVQRFGGVYQKTFKPSLPANAAEVPAKIQVQLSGEKQGLQASILKVLRQHGYRITQNADSGAWRFLAQKKRWGNWGSFITHIAFVILIAGALLGSIAGFKGFLSAGIGSTVPIQKINLTKGQISENFAIKINAAEDRILPNGERDNWYTDLSVLENGQEVVRRTLSVNHPFSYHGVTFYQAQFSQGAKFDVDYKGQHMPAVLQNRGENYFQAPGTDLYLIVAAMKTDPQDLIVLYQVYKGNAPEPVKTAQLKMGETANIENAYTLKFEGLVPITGLQVKKDPGVGIVWLGSFLLLLGLLLSFYWRPLMLTGVWDEEQSLVVIGAAAGKRSSKAQEDLNSLSLTIKAEYALPKGEE